MFAKRYLREPPAVRKVKRTPNWIRRWSRAAVAALGGGMMMFPEVSTRAVVFRFVTFNVFVLGGYPLDSGNPNM
jgi:hypothetical protein